jgi:hypothetical protein
MELLHYGIAIIQIEVVLIMRLEWVSVAKLQDHG